MTLGNLLIVDDEELICEKLKVLLTSYADSIETANHGLEGLKVLEEKQIHCIICDINMPAMNGLEFIKQIRKMKINTPLIFFTSYDSEIILKEAIQYGVFEFLTKPDFERLYDAVKRGLLEGLKLLKNTLNPENSDLFYDQLIKDFDQD